MKSQLTKMSFQGIEPHKAVVLLSGGQDSTTCLYWAKKKFETVIAVIFDYGQRHAVEIEAAKKIATDAGINYSLIPLRDILDCSALVRGTMQVNDQHDFDERLPATFTPGRNMLFLTIAMTIAYQHRCLNIITGVCETDYSGYPDCRRDFIDSIQKTADLAMFNDRENGNMFEIYTPLMSLSKAQTWKMAKELGILEVIINDTVTDYNGDMTMNEWGRGKTDNPASALRANGYFEAKKMGWI